MGGGSSVGKVGPADSDQSNLKQLNNLDSTNVNSQSMQIQQQKLHEKQLIEDHTNANQQYQPNPTKK